MTYELCIMDKLEMDKMVKESRGMGSDHSYKPRSEAVNLEQH